MTEDKMRKAWTFALFLIPLLSLAQQGPNRFPPINIYHGNPNGQACTTSMAIVQSDANGKSYTCFGGVWGPGSDGGSPTGQADNVIPLAGGPTSITKQSHIDENTPGVTNVSQPLKAPVVNTEDIPGYRQNALGARSRNRDGILEITITPQDMPGCATSGRGLIDDRPCFNAAIQYLATLDDHVQKRLILPYTQYGYSLRTPGYLQQLPHDFGDYHGFGGYITKASAMLQISNGVIATCSVASGSGYAPSANLPVYIFDPSLRGSGGAATVQTDATGLPTGCTVVKGGMNYPNTGVLAEIAPLGGHGAAASATLAGGVFATSQNPITPSAGGSGYVTYAATTVPVNVGGLTTNLVCTTYPTFTATVSNTTASVTAVNVATQGSACTYLGSADTTVPLAFGASCGGTQCTLLDPETVNNMPCGVALINNLTIEGIGNPTVSTGWNNSTADLNQMIAFCEPTGQQSTNITLKNFTIDNTFIGFYFPYEVHHLTVDGMTFGRFTAFPVHVFSFSGGAVGGASGLGSNANTVNIGASAPGPASTFTNITDWGYSGITCGGEWIGRSASGATATGGGLGAGNNMPGGYQTLLAAGFNLAPNIVKGMTTYAHWNNFEAVAPCGNFIAKNFLYYYQAGHSATTDTWDVFWEKYIWKTQNGPTTAYTSATQNLSNGQTACKITQTIVDRTLDYQFGNPLLNLAVPGFAANYPYSMCFPGVTYSVFQFQPRYSGNTAIPNPGVSFENILVRGYANRPPIFGRFDSLKVSGLQGFLGGTFTDPYLQTGETRGGVNITSYASFTSRIEDVVNIPASPAAFSPSVQFYQSGLPIIQGQYLRNVQGFIDAIPYIGNIGPTVPTGQAVATLDLIDTNSAVGSGGAILFSANGLASGMAAIKGSYGSTSTNARGDLVFYIRPVGASPMVESSRILFTGAWKHLFPEVMAGTQSVSGCSLTAAVGGAAAGKFASGTTGTCTVTITPGITAPNGYRCSATDLTTPANLIGQTTTSTTTCVISGTTASGDVITWQAIAY